MRYVLFLLLILIYRYSFSNECVEVFKSPHEIVDYKDRYSIFINRAKESFEKSQSAEEMVEIIMADNVRIQFFFLQGLTRLNKYAVKKSDKETLKKIKNLVKGMEDAIGKYSLASSLHQTAKDGYLSDSITSYLEIRKFAAREEFKSILVNEGWLNGKAFNKLDGLLKQIDWADKKLNSSSAIDSMLEALRELDKEIEEEIHPLITKRDFDYKSLEDGLHEFRRELRWVIINVMSTHDLYYYSHVESSTLSKEDYQLFAEYRNNKYTKFPTNNTGDVAIPTLPFLRLVRFVTDLGNIKDYGEGIHYIAEIGVQIGVYKDLESGKKNVAKSLSRKGSPVRNVQKESLAIYSRFHQKKPLEEIYKSLTQQSLLD